MSTALVVEALELLSTDTSLPCHELALDDGRLAMFLPVRTPTADLVGIAMILADGKALGDDTLERMAAAPVRAIMLRLAVLLKPAALRTAAAAAAPLELMDETQAAAAAVAVKPMSPVEVNDILEFDLPPNEMPAPRARSWRERLRHDEPGIRRHTRDRRTFPRGGERRRGACAHTPPRRLPQPAPARQSSSPTAPPPRRHPHWLRRPPKPVREGRAASARRTPLRPRARARCAAAKRKRRPRAWPRQPRR